MTYLFLGPKEFSTDARHESNVMLYVCVWTFLSSPNADLYQPQHRRWNSSSGEQLEPSSFAKI